MRHWRRAGTALAAALCVASLAGPSIARECDVDVVPAATLLFPYFEVDRAALEPPYPAPDRMTVFTVANILETPVIARVTLWTDWAIPTVAFDLPLPAHDVESFNLHDVFIGEKPVVGTVAGNCRGPLLPGRLHYNPALRPSDVAASDLARLRSAHGGDTVDLPGGTQIVTSALHPDLLTGYVTVDVVNRCSAVFPSTAGYFKNGGTGIAANTNSLVGDWQLIDLLEGSALAEPAVHIRADATFGSGSYTFYGRYVNGTGIDDRQPLPNVFATRFARDPTQSFEPRTDLIFWRDTKSPVIEPPAPAVQMHWFPLPLAGMLSCDENAVCKTAGGFAQLATQRVHLGPGEDLVPRSRFGWLRIRLDHNRRPPEASKPLFGGVAQGWVVTAMGAEFPGGYTGGAMRAIRYATALPGTCAP
jgi:hypothetical protein